ncbi:MAG: ATP-binding protein [Puniceicoccaceae bacterium]
MTQPHRHITNSCPVVIDRAGNIVEFQDTLVDVLNLPRQQITGQSMDAILNRLHPGWGQRWTDHIAQGNFRFVLDSLSSTHPVTAPFHLEFQILVHQEHLFATISRIETTDDGFEGSIKDLLEDPARISQLFLRLQRSESRLESYMHHFPGVFFYQRTDFSFQYISPNFERLLDFEPDRLLRSGSQFLGMIFDQDRDFFVSELRKHSTLGRSFTLQYRMRKPADQSVIYLTDVRSPVYSASGMLLGYEGVWLDTTRQIIAERKLTSTAWKENLAMLTAGLVHDFSNIMAGIYALSELYHASMSEGDSMYEGLGQIKKSSMEARKLVRRIIDINREEAGQKNYHDPKKLIYEQLDLLKIIFPRGTQIDLDLCGDEIPVYIDDVEFRQILLNLAMNSKDALTNGKGQILIQTRRVHSGESLFDNAQRGSRSAPKTGILISFRDNGSGIPKLYRDRIFNSFFTTKEIHKGSGFGLYNIRRILQSADGMIDFETEEGNGTVFHLYLPEADFTEQSTSAEHDLHLTFLPVEQRPLIVIYCHEDASQFDLVTMLRSKNWEVIVFSEPAKMKTYLKETRRFPNLCLFIDSEMDSRVPDLCNTFKSIHPDTLFALYARGRNPDEIPHTHSKEMALICDSNMDPRKIVESLEKLIRSPLTIR